MAVNRAKVANKGNFLRTWILPKLLTVHVTPILEILGKLIRTHNFPESIASKFETERVETQQHSASARQFSKLPTNFSSSALFRDSFITFSSPLPSSYIRTGIPVQRIIPAASLSPFSFSQILLLPSDSSWAQTRSTSRSPNSRGNFRFPTASIFQRVNFKE